MLEFNQIFKDAPVGAYKTFEVSGDMLALQPGLSRYGQLKELLDELPDGAWIAGSAAMAVHDRIVPPIAREIPKGSFNGDTPMKVVPGPIEYSDIDIFCRDEAVLSRVCSALNGLDYKSSRVSKVSIHFEPPEEDYAVVQVISFAGFPTIERALDVFDIETCCFALMKKTSRTLGERFREARIKAGKSMNDAADVLGITYPQLVNIESDLAAYNPNQKSIDPIVIKNASSLYEVDLEELDPPDAYYMVASLKAIELLPSRQLQLRHVHTPIATLNRAFKYMQRGFMMPAQDYMQIFKICHELMQIHQGPKEFIYAAFFGWLAPIGQKAKELSSEGQLLNVADKDLNPGALTFVSLGTVSFEPTDSDLINDLQLRHLSGGDEELEEKYKGSREVMKATEEVGGYEREFDLGEDK